MPPFDASIVKPVLDALRGVEQAFGAVQARQGYLRRILIPQEWQSEDTRRRAFDIHTAALVGELDALAAAVEAARTALAEVRGKAAA